MMLCKDLWKNVFLAADSSNERNHQMIFLKEMLLRKTLHNSYQGINNHSTDFEFSLSGYMTLLFSYRKRKLLKTLADNYVTYLLGILYILQFLLRKCSQTFQVDTVEIYNNLSCCQVFFWIPRLREQKCRPHAFSMWGTQLWQPLHQNWEDS